MNQNFLINFLVTFPLTWFLIYFSLPLFRKFLPDKPSLRSSHNKTKPTGGGIIFVLTSSLSFIINGDYFLLANSLLGLIGFIDDKFNLSVLLRFIFQFLFVNFLIQQSDLFNSFFTNNIFIINIIFWLASNLILIGIINFINFMDGMDGLIGGSIIFVIFLSANILNLNFYGVIFSLLAFLYWNWPPSKIFMGDTGSTFLGGFLVSVILKSNTFEESTIIFISLSPLWIDSFICLLRRFYNKQKIFQSHKLHLYQRLNQNGWSHSRVSIIYILSSLLLTLCCLSKNWSLIITGFTSLILFGFYLEKSHAKPFRKIS